MSYMCMYEYSCCSVSKPRIRSNANITSLHLLHVCLTNASQFITSLCNYILQQCLAIARSKSGEPEVGVKHICHLVIKVVSFKDIWSCLPIPRIQARLVLCIPGIFIQIGSECASGSVSILYCHIVGWQ